MIFHTNIVISELEPIINMLKQNEIPVYGTKVDYGMDVRTFKEKDKRKYCLVMGNEGNGVSENVLDLVCRRFLWMTITFILEK